ncbi:MAG: hypothetical protein Q4A78_01820 [Peptostreptococcaceae bacterium]|nr:hypothetical protein [Peptostreptococcaceae bacterium]
MTARKSGMGKNVFIIFLILFGFFQAYQLQFSETARIEKNLKSFERMRSFHSLEVDESDLKNIERRGSGYQFTVLTKEEVGGYQELGKVQMNDAEGGLIHTFTLLKNENRYMVHMRGIYMSMD